MTTDGIFKEMNQGEGSSLINKGSVEHTSHTFRHYCNHYNSLLALNYWLEGYIAKNERIQEWNNIRLDFF